MNTKRRSFLQLLGLGTAFHTVPGAFAAALEQTPRIGPGPFFPDQLPLDIDNDLILVSDSLTPAVGEISYVSGRVLGPDGEPIRNAVVEIWEADRSGIYIHSASGPKAKADNNFQGYGRFITAQSGEYLFRTIKPEPYTGRCPHIHFAVTLPGREKWTTEMYVRGHYLNARDSVARFVKNVRALEIEFKPMPEAKAGELSAKFDIVMGFTPTV